MTNYREILRLSALGLSQQSIAQSCNASKRTVNTVLKAARRENICKWGQTFSCPTLPPPITCEGVLNTFMSVRNHFTHSLIGFFFSL